MRPVNLGGRTFERLSRELKRYRFPAVAFSGGTDSAFLLAVVRRIFGERVLAITVDFPYIPRRTIRRSEDIAQLLKVNHIILRDEDILVEKEIAYNRRLRCYVCKKKMMGLIRDVAKEEGCDVVLDGTNTDDLREMRPGLKALEELGVVSPLAAVGITRRGVEKLARELGIPINPPETCILTRLPPNTPVDVDLVRRIDLAEEIVIQIAEVSLVRVRYWNGGARIEVLPSEIDKLVKDEVRGKINSELSSLGFYPVTLDLEGYNRSR